MTKKHFITIAAIIQARTGFNQSTIDFDAGFNTAVERLANDLADYFETENERFDRDTFMAACGMV